MVPPRRDQRWKSASTARRRLRNGKVPGPGLIGTRGGKLTIGVGHLLTKSELASGKIWIHGQAAAYATGLSDSQILDLLGRDLAGAVQAVNEGVEVELSQNQFDTLVSFCFNVGSSAFKNSTLLEVAQSGRLRRSAGPIAPLGPVQRRGGPGVGQPPGA